MPRVKRFLNIPIGQQSIVLERPECTNAQHNLKCTECKKRYSVEDIGAIPVDLTQRWQRRSEMAGKHGKRAAPIEYKTCKSCTLSKESVLLERRGQLSLDRAYCAWADEELQFDLDGQYNNNEEEVGRWNELCRQQQSEQNEDIDEQKESIDEELADIDKWLSDAFVKDP